ncbi:MAG TPA: glycosyl hydrolase, partial [Anseongella sp.]|nr:glycosyl hydrolase [Anseongella sp.]
DSLLPGMTMGPYGVHWDRRQTWWPMAGAYHRYISRCQHILQQGRHVADILYLTPEGAPHVFRPPASALTGDEMLPDRKGYNFDGCPPGQLYKATVKDGRIVFPGGASYRLLVLPYTAAMTPRLLEKIRSLVKAGALVAGEPPGRSQGLAGFPASDVEVQALAKELWGGTAVPESLTSVSFGKGKVIWGGPFSRKDTSLYLEYGAAAALLKETGLPEDFRTSGPVRYTHRSAQGWDIYFVANRSDRPVTAECVFRSAGSRPELWDPLTGEIRALPVFSQDKAQTSIPLQFEAYQSFFIVFPRDAREPSAGTRANFPSQTTLKELEGPWKVRFDPRRGGPDSVVFDRLTDWSLHPEEGIRYYSGTAVYRKSFDFREPENSGNARFFLHLGEVHNMARVSLNGKDLGTVWTAPWKADLSPALRKGKNELRVEVVNLWPNRLIGDEHLPYDGIQDGQWPAWLREGKQRSSRRHTFTTFRPYSKDSPLLRSGLLGPVSIRMEEFR